MQNHILQEFPSKSEKQGGVNTALGINNNIYINGRVLCKFWQAESYMVQTETAEQL